MGIEDGVSPAECLARATDISESLKCLHASETIRKPRLTFIQNEGLGCAKTFHPPDGPAQQAREKMFRRNPVVMLPTWDGKHIDNPLDETRRDLGLAYVAGHRVIDFVSLFCLHLRISGTSQAVMTNREFAPPDK
jgi:salicylate hydroxylase